MIWSTWDMTPLFQLKRRFEETPRPSSVFNFREVVSSGPVKSAEIPSRSSYPDVANVLGKILFHVALPRPPVNCAFEACKRRSAPGTARPIDGYRPRSSVLHTSVCCLKSIHSHQFEALIVIVCNFVCPCYSICELYQFQVLGNERYQVSPQL